MATGNAREEMLDRMARAYRERDIGPEPRGPGRPEIGPLVNVRMRPDMVARLDELAERYGTSRAETVRRLLEDGLRRARMGVD